MRTNSIITVTACFFSGVLGLCAGITTSEANHQANRTGIPSMPIAQAMGPALPPGPVPFATAEDGPFADIFVCWPSVDIDMDMIAPNASVEAEISQDGTDWQKIRSVTVGHRGNEEFCIHWTVKTKEPCHLRLFASREFHGRIHGQYTLRSAK